MFDAILGYSLWFTEEKTSSASSLPGNSRTLGFLEVGPRDQALDSSARDHKQGSRAHTANEIEDRCARADQIRFRNADRVPVKWSCPGGLKR